MENINLHLNDTGELIIREGNAVNLIEPRALNISGDITAPAHWLETKKDDIDFIKAHFVINRESAEIKLVLNADQENNRLTTVITGRIEFDNRFKEFKINSGFRWDLNDLANFLKFNRKRFAVTDEAMQIVSGLKSFRASVSRDIEKTQDDRGNHRRLDDKRITSALPEVFTLDMPVFKNDITKTFDVELCIEEKEGVVRAFLQSVSLEEYIEERINDLIEDEIVKIPDGFTIIEI